MVAQPSGLIGLPLRLLAREVYGRIVEKKGADTVALITGEEKIVPRNPRFWVSTVEAMPLDLDTDFVAIDEVQLAGDLERGHVFTDRILNLRGRAETLLLGAATARPLLERLLPGINVITRPRMSVLSYAGSKKITRLPARSAVVAFSSGEVYAIAELIRRQRGGAAVVLGSLSPRTRNAQVELFQNGDVEHLVATDAIGMGLNLDVDHIAFAGNRKFDGYQYRALSRAEIGQIAGRAGRHTRDGTFGVTGRVDPFDDELVESIESHRFDALKVFQWRNTRLDFSSLDTLVRTLEMVPVEQGLTRAPPADDMVALEHAARDPDIRALATSPKRISLLWDVCQVPDYRKIAPANHADLVATLYGYLTRQGAIPDDWFSHQVSLADRLDGDIDTLANRIAHIRTWTFVANRADWLRDPAHWQGVTRAIEDRLSDALHEKLTQRFVDRRTSVLMRRLRENAMLEAEITGTGDVLVEGQHVGQLQGFRFAPDTGAEGSDAKAVRAAAQKALVTEIEARAGRLSRAPNEDFALSADGTIRWQGEPVGRLIAGETTLAPSILTLADETLTGPARDGVQERLATWVKAHVDALLKPLRDLEGAEGLEGLARGIAFRLVEGLGILERSEVADDIRQLDQTMRASLRKLGVRFGAYHIYVPALLKPAPSQLIAELWALRHGSPDMPGLAELPQLSASGRTSMPVDPAISHDLYKVVGFRVCGPRAVRIDILERLADLIRPLIAWKPLDKTVAPPDGAVPQGGAFTITIAMTSLLGCAGEDFAAVLKSLGYRSETREIERPVVAATQAQNETVAGTGGETGEPAGEPAAVAVALDAAIEESAAVSAGSESAEAPEDEAAAIDRIDGAGDEIAEPAAADAASETASETVTVEIWRPGRGDRRPHGRSGEHRQEQRRDGRQGGNRRHGGERGSDHQHGEARNGARSGKRTEGGRGDNARGFGRDRGHDRGQGRPHHQGGPRKPAPQRDKPIDPDSPFAALMALKNSLEKGNGDKS
ncbi:helicase [Stappia sp. F7233]|uniref:Helicase n=2 Tax=Stappia albiluteola TaxID=2758565 RepID=A0A839AG94_9HYPH|nr:helicase [Stappia albiluteola]